MRTDAKGPRSTGWLTRTLKAYAFARRNCVAFPWQWANRYADRF